MEQEMINNFKEQHIETYRNAILENIKNNTRVLVDDDIMSLIDKPPLDSMDSIKNKFLSLAKKNKIILNTDELSSILDDYRNDLKKSCDKIRSLRVEELSSKIDKVSLEERNSVIIFYKKDFIALNKEIRKIMKNQLLSSYESIILKKINCVFKDLTDENLQEKIILELSKFMKGNYQKQLLENLDIKILVKDTTLINGIKEQSERYLFTLNHSRLLNDED